MKACYSGFRPLVAQNRNTNAFLKLDLGKKRSLLAVNEVMLHGTIRNDDF